MKKKAYPLANVLSICFASLLMFFFFAVAWIWGKREEWVRFSLAVAWGLAVSMWIPALLVCAKIDQKFTEVREMLSIKEQHATHCDDSAGARNPEDEC